MGECMSLSVAKGQGVTLNASFVDANGDAFDPVSVVFHYREPSGLEGSLSYPTDPEVVKVAIGEYSVGFVMGVVGRWTFKTRSEGTPAAASADAVVRCEPSEF